MPVPRKKQKIERSEDNPSNVLQFAVSAAPVTAALPDPPQARKPIGQENLNHAAILLIEAAYDLAGRLPPERVTEIMRLAKQVEVLSKSLR